MNKPIITLKSLENFAVNTQTKESYDSLMQVYELAGIEWATFQEPTTHNVWDEYKNETTVALLFDGLHYGDRKSYRENYGEGTVILTQTFFALQEISQEKLSEVKNYFSEKESIEKKVK